MATLNTLRTKGGWIITIVIALALLAFLIGDLAGGNSMFGVKEKVGAIGGEKISYLDYDRKVQFLTEINKIESPQAEDQTDAVRDYAWQTLINERAMLPGLEKLGITSGDDELFERMYGENISPVLLGSPFFRNPETGLFDKAELRTFVNDYRSDATGRSGLYWQYLQQQVRNNAVMSKYVALLGGMSYVTKVEAGQAAALTASNYDGRYVMQSYTSMPDSLFKVSTAEAEKYYNERRELYRQPAVRNLEYVLFEIAPSPADYAAAREAMTELSAEFAQAENPEQFVSLNSDDPFDAGYYTREQMPAELAAYAFDPERAPVYGPTMEGDTYRAVRVVDQRTFPDTIAFRQMGFAPGTEALADSVYNVLQNGGDFLLLADQYSVIPPQQAESGPVPTNFLPAELGDILYPAGERYRRIDNANGSFIFEVYYRGASSPKVQLAMLTKNVEASTETQQAGYAKASAFFTATAGTAANFTRTATDSSYLRQPVRLEAGQNQIAGLEESRELIRWAFNAKVNDISPILDIDDHYVVALLTGAREDGYAPLSEVQVGITATLIREKKFAALAEKMTGASSLDALASTLSAPVGELTAVNYDQAPYLPGVGMEPGLIGVAAGGVEQGMLSKPVEGMNGAYVVETTSQTEVPAVTPEEWQVRIAAQNEENLAQRAFEAVMRKSNVVDGRAKYF